MTDIIIINNANLVYICFIIIIFDYNSNIAIIMLYYARMYKAGSSSITNAIAPADGFCASLLESGSVFDKTRPRSLFSPWKFLLSFYWFPPHTERWHQIHQKAKIQIPSLLTCAMKPSFNSSG